MFRPRTRTTRSQRHCRSPYYQESWSFELREIEGLPVVSDVQLYLYLSAYPKRGADQAERIRERVLALEDAEAGS